MKEMTTDDHNVLSIAAAGAADPQTIALANRPLEFLKTYHSQHHENIFLMHEQCCKLAQQSLFATDQTHPANTCERNQTNDLYF